VICYDMRLINMLSEIQLLPKAKRLHSSNIKREYGPGRCQALQARHIVLTVEITSAFNTTTHHDKLLSDPSCYPIQAAIRSKLLSDPGIMYDLGFSTDAIDVVKNLYMEACTNYDYPQAGEHTGSIPFERFTIRKETPFPLFFF